MYQVHCKIYRENSLEQNAVSTSKKTNVSHHLTIPLKPQEKPAQFPNEFYNTLMKEYATKYLEKIGAKPTPENLAMVAQNIPISKCRVMAAWKSRGCLEDVLHIDPYHEYKINQELVPTEVKQQKASSPKL